MRHCCSSPREKKGSTIIELMVSIGLFLVLVSISIGVFTQALRAERQAGALLASNSNASLTLEQMAREIRTSYGFCDGGSCVLPDPLELVFINARGEEVHYRLNNGAIERRTINRSTNVDSDYQPITAGNVVIHYLNFWVLDDPAYPTRVTISIGVSPEEGSLRGSVTQIQTTVSPRFL